MTASDATVVALADGSVAAIRPIAVGDGPVIAAAFEALSPESRYRRFLQPMSRLNERTLSFLLDVDHHDREALVAEDVATGRPLAVARFGRSRDDPAAAELAVAVVDDAQGNGLGSAITHRLVDRAREEGITRFTALILTDNRASLALIHELGMPKAIPHGSGTVEVSVDLPAAEGIGGGVRNWLRSAACDKVEFTSAAARANR
ncbi:MAG: N-acetyltransferase family protein [Solirubrobacteraceae bacterium]